jgi:Flp pilus assembly protein TadD
MTNATKTPIPTLPQASQPRPGFQPIPTRIRDVRDAQVPPLVVNPIADANRQAVTESLTELGARLADVHRTAAEAWLSQGAYDKALPHLETAATFAPTEPEYHHQLGFVRYITGDDVGAINSFNTVLAADGNNSEAWFNLGMVLFGQSQFTEAEDCFRRSLDTNPGDAQTWNNRGVCLWRINRTGDARACFQRALQIDPNDQDAIYNLSNIR